MRKVVAFKFLILALIIVFVIWISKHSYLRIVMPVVIRYGVQLTLYNK